MSHPARQVGSQLEEAGVCMEVGGRVQGRSAKWDSLWWVMEQDTNEAFRSERENLPQHWAPKCLLEIASVHAESHIRKSKMCFKVFPRQPIYSLYITVFEPYLIQ